MNEKNSAAEMTGHPAGLSGGTAAVDQPMKVEEGQAKIKFGSHEFNSVEELTQAYEKLESTLGRQANEVGELRSTMKTERVVSTSPRRQLDFKKLGDTIIEDPEAGVREITSYVEEMVDERVSQVQSQVKSEQSVAAKEETVWNKFFEANPWLGHRKQEVQLVAYQVLWPEIQGKTSDDQFKTIANHFRDATERSAAVLDGKELPQRRPVSVSSNSPSGVSTPQVRPAEGEKKKSFSDSVRDQSYAQKAAF